MDFDVWPEGYVYDQPFADRQDERFKEWDREDMTLTVIDPEPWTGFGSERVMEMRAKDTAHWDHRMWAGAWAENCVGSGVGDDVFVFGFDAYFDPGRRTSPVDVMLAFGSHEPWEPERELYVQPPLGELVRFTTVLNRSTAPVNLPDLNGDGVADQLPVGHAVAYVRYTDGEYAILPSQQVSNTTELDAAAYCGLAITATLAEGGEPTGRILYDNILQLSTATATADGVPVLEMLPYTAGSVQLPRGAAVHLDASRMVSSEGAPVARWPDGSGNGRDATNTAPNDHLPTFRASAVAGQPGLYFDGDDYLLLDDVGEEWDEATLAFVIHPEPGRHRDYIWDNRQLYPGDQAGRVLLWDMGEGDTNVRFGQVNTPSPTSWLIYPGPQGAMGEPRVVQLRLRSGDRAELWVDDVLRRDATGEKWLAVHMGGYLGMEVTPQLEPRVAGSENLHGYIAEIIAYDRYLNDSEAADMRAALRNKYQRRANTVHGAPDVLQQARTWLRAQECSFPNEEQLCLRPGTRAIVSSNNRDDYSGRTDLESVSGRPALTFDSSRTPWPTIYVYGPDDVDEYTVIQVAERETASETAELWITASGANPERRAFSNAGYGRVATRSLYWPNGTSEPSLDEGLRSFTDLGADPFITTYEGDAAGRRLYFNGNLADRSDTSMPSSLIARLAYGTFDGRIYEHIAFDRVLTAAERSEVEAYLAQRYQTPAPAHGQPHDLYAWIRADECGPNASGVFTCTDLSGQGHDAVVRAGRRGPAVIPDGPGGRFGLDFSDADDQLRINGLDAQNSADELTVVVAGVAPVTGLQRLWLSSLPDGQQVHRTTLTVNADELSVAQTRGYGSPGAEVSEVPEPPAALGGVPFVAAFRVDRDELSVYVDGQRVGTEAAADVPVNLSGIVGWAGTDLRLSEAMVFGRALSQVELALVTESLVESYSRDDCFGVPGGPAQLDRCGVCEGSNDCLDCAGVPNGSTVVDQCGVCGGDGFPEGACDCAGNTLDECNVCGGSGVAPGNCDCAGTPLSACITDAIQQPSLAEGLYTWIRADQCVGGGAGVECADLSGRDHPARVPLLATGPVVVDGFGGHPMLDFNAATEPLQVEGDELADAITVTIVTRGGMGHFPLWRGLSELDDGTQHLVILAKSYTAGYFHGTWQHYDRTPWIDGDYQSQPSFYAGSIREPVAEAPAVVTLVQGANRSRIFLDGELVQDLAIPAFPKELNGQLGAVGTTSLSEALVYGRELSDAELASLHAYLLGRYQIQQRGPREDGLPVVPPGLYNWTRAENCAPANDITACEDLSGRGNGAYAPAGSGLRSSTFAGSSVVDFSSASGALQLPADLDGSTTTEATLTIVASGPATAMTAWQSTFTDADATLHHSRMTVSNTLAEVTQSRTPQGDFAVGRMLSAPLAQADGLHVWTLLSQHHHVSLFVDGALVARTDSPEADVELAGYLATPAVSSWSRRRSALSARFRQASWTSCTLSSGLATTWLWHARRPRCQTASGRGCVQTNACRWPPTRACSVPTSRGRTTVQAAPPDGSSTVAASSSRAGIRPPSWPMRLVTWPAWTSRPRPASASVLMAPSRSPLRAS